ncbi:methyltransferase [Natronospirillum operosum]|nr:methyltransferase [Natronospirillum operosum]
MSLDLLLLALGVSLALSLVWSTLRSGMSPMPSSRAARAAMLEALQGTEGPIADLGSGWGQLGLAAAKRFPARQVIGYELSWLPWLYSVAVARCLRCRNLTFYRRDAFAALARQDPMPVRTVVCYLHGEGMARLRQTLDTGEHSCRWIISNNFALPGCQPDHQWRLRDFYRSPVYRYRWPDCLQ